MPNCLSPSATFETRLRLRGVAIQIANGHRHFTAGKFADCVVCRTIHKAKVPTALQVSDFGGCSFRGQCEEVAPIYSIAGTGCSGYVGQERHCKYRYGNQNFNQAERARLKRTCFKATGCGAAKCLAYAASPL